MGLTLHIQGSGVVPGGASSIPLQGGALTIGRAAGNDLILPDPDRVVSSRHCVIEDRHGEYVVLDISTNGTFMNYAPGALGPSATPLNSGDILIVGPYELRVVIEGGAAAGVDFLADLAPTLADEELAPAGRRADNLPGFDGPGGDENDDFLGDLLGAGPAAGPSATSLSAPPPEPMSLIPDDDDFLGGKADPFEGYSHSEQDHTASANDFFAAPDVNKGGAGFIPDDWDLSAPEPEPAPPPRLAPPAPPQPRPAPTPATAPLIPEGLDDDDLLGPMDPPQPEPALKPAAAPLIPEGLDDDDLLGPLDPPQPEPAPTGLTPRPPAHEETQAPAPKPAAPQAPPPQPTPPAPQAAAPVAVPSAGGSDLARMFLNAAGGEKVVIPDEDLPAAMERAGTAYRKMVEGLREVLMTRASIKSEFRLGQTMIAPDGNNPIKFSVSPSQAIEAMLRPGMPGYLPADRAADEALKDIKAHEVAMMTGMQAAIQAMLKKFDPKVLAGQIEGKGGLFGGKKARYWDEFERLYSKIAEEAEDDFQNLFGKAFAEAYRTQLKKL